MTTPFVICIRADSTTPWLFTDNIELFEPCFLPQNYCLEYSLSSLNDKVLSYFAHKITRTPGDLLSHVRRVLLYYQAESPEGSYGALLDLFIALGNKGGPLRARLLNHIADILELEHWYALSKVLVGGIKGTCKVPYSHYARLYGIANDTMNLVELISPSSSYGEYDDPWAEARDLINSGQIMAAQTALEQALLVAPERDDLSLELLDLYRCTRDKDGLLVMLEMLVDTPLAARAAWDELAVGMIAQDDRRISSSA